MAYVVTQEMLEALTDMDQEALVSIYHHRCLDTGLLYKHYYRKENEAKAYAEERVKYLLDNGYITAVDYGDELPALFLDTLGAAAVRRILIYPEARTHSAASLKMKTLFIRHQINLNDVVLEIEAEAIRHNIPYEYYDCKFMDFNGEVMPDGMFRFNGCDVLLEMDMGHEQAPDLAYKWQNYRSFLNSEKFCYGERKVIVLFLLRGVKRLDTRRATILTSLGKGLLDKMTPQFDVYIDGPEALQRVLFDEVLNISDKLGQVHGALGQLGFSTALATPFNSLLTDTGFDFYTRMLSGRTRKVIVRNGRTQEFLLDIAPSGLPASFLAKAIYHSSASLLMASKLGRSVPYLIVGDSEKAIESDLKAVDGRGLKNVYFTTLSRLQKAVTIADAVFQIDQLGRIYHFTNAGLDEPVFERTI